jgi:hypothetical protein
VGLTLAKVMLSFFSMRPFSSRLLLSLLLCRFASASPVITRQPQTVVDELGKISSLSVGATGDGPLRYQWFYFDKYSGQATSPIDGATNAVFTPAQLPLVVEVAVKVYDSDGSTLSQSATIDWVQRSALTELSRWPGLLKAPAMSSAIKGNLAYVAAGTLQVFDISDPRSPARVGPAVDYFAEDAYERWQVPNPLAVKVEGDIGCMLYGSFYVYDLHDPIAPQLLSTTQAGGDRFILENGFAYVCANYSGVVIIDVHHPRDPQIVSTILSQSIPSSLSRLLNVALRGDVLYVADADRGFEQGSSFHIFDVSDKTKPTQIEERPGATYAVGVDGDKLFTVGDGLQIFDIREPRNPKLLGKLNGTFDRMNVESLSATNGFVYLCYGTNGLWRYDVRDPLKPREAGRLVNGGTANDLQIVGDIGYVSSGELGWQVVDLSAFPDPVVIRGTDSSTAMVDLVVTNDIAFAAAKSSGVEIVDFTALATPKELARFSTVAPAQSIALRSDILYVACGASGVELVDVRDPSAPLHVRTVEFPGEFAQVVLTSGTNLIVGTDRSVYLLDITTATVPESVWHAFSLLQFTQIALWDNSVVVDTRQFPDETLYVLDLSTRRFRTAKLPLATLVDWSPGNIYTAIHTPLESCDAVQLKLRASFGKANNPYNNRAFTSEDLLLTHEPIDTTFIYDLSTPTQPAMLDNGPGSPGSRSFQQLVPVGSRIYAASGGAGIQVLEWDSGVPQILAQPHIISSYSFGTLNQTLTLKTRGARPLSYQWYEGNKGDTNRALPFGFAAGLSWPMLFFRADDPLFRTKLSITAWVRVSNEFGSVDSESATVSFLPNLNVVKSAQNLLVDWNGLGSGTWILESSSDVDAWATVPDAVVSQNAPGQFSATLPAREKSAQFFRLRYVPSAPTVAGRAF